PYASRAEPPGSPRPPAILAEQVGLWPAPGGPPERHCRERAPGAVQPRLPPRQLEHLPDLLRVRAPASLATSESGVVEAAVVQRTEPGEHLVGAVGEVLP